MTLAVFVVCEQVRLATGAVSIVLCTLGGARSMAGKWDRVRRAICSYGPGVGVFGIGLSGGFGKTTLVSGVGGLSLQGRSIGRRIERGWREDVEF